MIGHRQILDARMAGYNPACVFLNIGPAPTPTRLQTKPEDVLAEGALPEVWTDGASPLAADLRFLRGMRVHVALMGAARVEFWPWWDAAAAAQPARMYGVEPDGEVIEWQA